MKTEFVKDAFNEIGLAIEQSIAETKEMKNKDLGNCRTEGLLKALNILNKAFTKNYESIN